MQGFTLRSQGDNDFKGDPAFACDCYGSHGWNLGTPVPSYPGPGGGEGVKGTADPRPGNH